MQNNKGIPQDWSKSTQSRICKKSFKFSKTQIQFPQIVNKSSPKSRPKHQNPPIFPQIKLRINPTTSQNNQETKKTLQLQRFNEEEPNWELMVEREMDEKNEWGNRDNHHK